jgi:hypothetical protein
MVESTRVVGRRQLHFESYEDLLADVHAMNSQPTRQLGNWTLGQICEHLAKAIEYAVDGAPFKAPWPLRVAGRVIKKRIISRPMKPGFRLPKSAAEYLPVNPDAATGIARLEAAIARYREVPSVQPHAIFGPMTRDEYDQLNFRHAEMHLSFIVPESHA